MRLSVSWALVIVIIIVIEWPDSTVSPDFDYDYEQDYDYEDPPAGKCEMRPMWRENSTLYLLFDRE
jgi:hypothetical protein